MADIDKAKLREQTQKRQVKITKIWQSFAVGAGKEAIKDLFEYIDGQREMYRKYAEDMAMPHPLDPKQSVVLSNDMIAGLLQSSRGLGIVKTYILNRIDSDVAQPIKKSK